MKTLRITFIDGKVVIVENVMCITSFHRSFHYTANRVENHVNLELDGVKFWEVY